MNNAISLATVVAVAVGGAIGSVARYLAGVALAPLTVAFPLATLVVNVIGAFLIGVFARLFGGTDGDPVVRLALTTGLCGGFTTFSTMSAEVVTLVQQGRSGRAALYVLLSLVLGFGATAVGLMVARPRS